MKRAANMVCEWGRKIRIKIKIKIKKQEQMKTILVIEDQHVMRHKTVTILKMEGYEVLEARDGLEGIRLAQEELPDLILCDIMMPERDGYAVLQAVRTNKITATTPFIFFTAKGEKG